MEMPSCCVPLCKPSGATGVQVAWFSPPKDEQLFLKWKEVIPKKYNEELSHSSKICQRHFLDKDIITFYEHPFDNNRETVPVPRGVPYLRKGSVPSIFPSSTGGQNINKGANNQGAIKCIKVVGEDHSNCLAKHIKESWEKECYSNVSFVCKKHTNSTRNTLSANKAVLAAASQKLSFLLAETGDDDVTIIIPESDFKTVEILLKYIYSGTFIVKSFTNDLEELIKDWAIGFPQITPIVIPRSTTRQGSSTTKANVVSDHDYFSKATPSEPILLRDQLSPANLELPIEKDPLEIEPAQVTISTESPVELDEPDALDIEPVHSTPSTSSDGTCRAPPPTTSKRSIDGVALPATSVKSAKIKDRPVKTASKKVDSVVSVVDQVASVNFVVPKKPLRVSKRLKNQAPPLTASKRSKNVAPTTTVKSAKNKDCKVKKKKPTASKKDDSAVSVVDQIASYVTVDVSKEPSRKLKIVKNQVHPPTASERSIDDVALPTTSVKSAKNKDCPVKTAAKSAEKEKPAALASKKDDEVVHQVASDVTVIVSKEPSKKSKRVKNQAPQNSTTTRDLKESEQVGVAAGIVATLPDEPMDTPEDMEDGILSQNFLEKEKAEQKELNEHLEELKETVVRHKLYARHFLGSDVVAPIPRIQRGINRIACATCGKMISRDYMTEHLKIHSNERPYVCDHCGAAHSTSNILRRHVINRHSDQIHKCSMCDKEFRTKRNLQLHLTMHSGQKPYSCLYCDKSFRLNSTLERHKRIHTGEKPYECETCHMKFSARSNYVKHLDTHIEKSLRKVRPIPPSRIRSNIPRIPCVTCGKVVRSDSMNSHLFTHKKERPFLCDQCGATFVFADSLKKHTANHTDEPVKPRSYEPKPKKSFTCSYCKEEFQEYKKYRLHLAEHTGRKPVEFPCPYCDKILWRLDHLKRHKRVHTGEKPEVSKKSYTCPSCDQEFQGMAKYRFHLSQHTGESAGYPCPYCDKVFKRRDYLTSHKRTHIKPYECEVCHKKFGWRPVYLNHLKIHKKYDNVLGATVDSETSLFTCEICDTSFHREYAYLIHVAFHNGEDPMLPCRYCPETFPSIKLVREHAQEKHVDSLLRCDQCPSMFHTKNDLRNHKRTHKEDREHVCEDCKKEFKTKTQLDSHKRQVHSDERPFTCRFCSKGFKMQAALRQHEMIHTGERRYKCPHCAKSFKQSVHLDNHVRIHTGEKPYVCEYCAKAFSNSNNLRIHLMIHTGNKAQCATCGQVFRSIVKLREHESTQRCHGKVVDGVSSESSEEDNED